MYPLIIHILTFRCACIASFRTIPSNGSYIALKFFAKNTGALARANDVMIRTDHICDAGPRVAHAAMEWEILPLSINSCPISLV